VKIYKKSYRDFFTKTLAYRNYVISFLIGVAFHLLLQGFFLTLSTFNPTSIEEGLLKSYTQHTNNFSLGNSLVIGLISLIILTPIFEEILFRGLVTHALRQNFSAKIYIPLQAFIFAILHMQLLHVFYTFILGLILGICYEKYKNILYPIFLHVGFNIFNIFLVTR
jgi:membrane protease YdiL (CAAX protease family)